MSNRRWSWGALALISVASPLAGCAEAPFGMARLNPMLTKEWEKDEKFGPTIHTKRGELQTLATKAASLPPSEQQRLSTELVGMLREEKNSLLARDMVRTLAEFPTPQSLEGLHLAIEHSDSDVRAVACEAWRKKGGQEGLDALVKALASDTDVDVRIAAARELGHFRKQAAVDSLGNALEDHNPALQFRCVQSLKEITGRNLGDSVSAWRQYVAGGEAKPADTPSWTEKIQSAISPASYFSR